MPDQKTIQKAKADKREGKSPSTQAGEFVHAEMDKIRHGEHGARSAKQAIAIGLSEARRAGVDLPPPRRGTTKARTRKSAQYAYETGQGKRKPKSRSKKRARAAKRALRREPRRAASHRALSRQAHSAASRRSAAARSRAAKKAARTKGRSGRAAAARKAARARKRRA
jgi:Family of unknown function (DUF6496)